MNKGLASSTAFYILGMVFGLFTILYFGMEVIIEISPAVKSVILFLSSITFFSATGLATSKWRNIPLYFLASVSYLIFVGYTLVRFNFGSATTFLILAGSSTAFLAAGFMVNEKQVNIPEKKARYLVAAGVIMIIGLFLLDLSGPQAQADTTFRNSLNMSNGEEKAIGTVQINNDFILPRATELPDYRACTEDPLRANVYVEKEGDTVSGKSKVEMELKARLYGPQTENMTSKTFTVKQTEDCVEKEGQISVYESRGPD